MKCVHAVNLERNRVALNQIILSEQVVQERTSQLDAFESEVVAICRIILFYEYFQHAIHHVSDEIRLFHEIDLADMRQKEIGQDLNDATDGGSFGECGNELECGLLIENAVAVVDRRNEEID